MHILIYSFKKIKQTKKNSSLFLWLHETLYAAIWKLYLSQREWTRVNPSLLVHVTNAHMGTYLRPVLGPD